METKAQLHSKALGRRVLEAKEDYAHRQYRVDTMALLLQSDWIILEAVSKMSFGLPLFGGIGASFQILDNQQVACSLKLGSAAILNQNPIFEMASRNNSQSTCN
jgi:hypothetical protein